MEKSFLSDSINALLMQYDFVLPILEAGHNVIHAAIELANLLSFDSLFIWGVDNGSFFFDSHCIGATYFDYCYANQDRFSPLTNQTFRSIASNLQDKTSNEYIYSEPRYIIAYQHMIRMLKGQSGISQIEGLGLELNVKIITLLELSQLISKVLLEKEVKKMSFKDYVDHFIEEKTDNVKEELIVKNDLIVNLNQWIELYKKGNIGKLLDLILNNIFY